MRQWYLVYPKGKELSLVAKAFRDFALEIRASLYERMESQWPTLAQFFRAAYQLPTADPPNKKT
jgi:hypothetical protein